MGKIARYWEPTGDGRLTCTLCPRLCKLRDGQRGMCFVRERRGDVVILDTYGRSSGFCIDPIEKKPLNHFYPGTPVLSFGTAGCNLACKFCQNHDISKSSQQDMLASQASPTLIANAARNAGCTSVAYTYNDPVIFLEYATDISAACRERGVKNVAVTAGYLTDAARPEFFGAMDAANIDLKAFTEEFYFKLTGAHIGPVLDSIKYAVNETDCWVELTTLLIPDANDSDAELHALCEWVMRECGPDVPLHFSAFHPDFRMLDTPRTPVETLLRARDIGLKTGLNHVYIGNAHNHAAQSSYCSGCQKLAIGRNWYELDQWHLDDTGHCTRCGTKMSGHFDGPHGTWGRTRKPVRLVAGP